MKEIRDELETYYGTKRNLQTILEELSLLTIGRNETVKEFNQKFKKLVNKLPGEKRKNFNVYDYFKALKPRTKVWEGLILSDCQNLNDAYEKAEKYDKLEERVPPNNRNLINMGHMNAAVMTTRNDKQCFNCGNWGHIKRYCPLNRIQKKPFNVGFPNNSQISYTRNTYDQGNRNARPPYSQMQPLENNVFQEGNSEDINNHYSLN